MKKTIAFIVCCLLVAVSGFAADTGFAPVTRSVKIMDNYTGAAGAARYSTPVGVARFPLKSVVINGTYAGGTFGNYTGVVTIQCAPTVDGPWQTCKDTANNNVTATNTNSHFNMTTLVQYVRASWTRTKQRVTVWLNYQSL